MNARHNPTARKVPMILLPFDTPAKVPPATHVLDTAALALSFAEMAVLERKVAQAAAVTDIETMCPCERDAQGRKWYDTRPMQDPRELPPEVLDLCGQTLAYALARQLVTADAARPYMVCINRQALA